LRDLGTALAAKECVDRIGCTAPLTDHACQSAGRLDACATNRPWRLYAISAAGPTRRQIRWHASSHRAGPIARGAAAVSVSAPRNAGEPRRQSVPIVPASRQWRLPVNKMYRF
jgi:hypothetical protein